MGAIREREREREGPASEIRPNPKSKKFSVIHFQLVDFFVYIYTSPVLRIDYPKSHEDEALGCHHKDRIEG